MEAHESTRKRLESTLPKRYEDHFAEKGFNSISHNNSVRKLVPMSQAKNILDANAAVDKEWEKLEKLPAWNLEKVHSRKELILEAQREKNKLPAWNLDKVHSKKALILGAQRKKNKLPAWNLDKVHSRKELILEAQREGRPVVNPMSSNQNLRVSRKPVNPQDCVWKNPYRKIMRTILQERHKE